VSSLTAPAKINLALVVGPRRDDGKHELVTVYERIDLSDTLTLGRSEKLHVDGFSDETLVGMALELVARAARVEPAWRVVLEKRIPVAAGLAGGSSDAAAALRLANATLSEPMSAAALHELAVKLGADVPFFLRPGPQLGEGDGTRLSAVQLPRDYCVLVVLPEGAAKPSTKAVYDGFDDRGGAGGFRERRATLLERLSRVQAAADLAGLPGNDLASSPLAQEIERLGAFRADVSGAGPAVYGLFATETEARRAASMLAVSGRTWVAFPTWYG
jgi:4-diphosphocytidyl-2-C-methyl-D-erythritol kinase